jgi:hypothetical protein
MGMVNDLLLNPRLVRLRLLVTRVAWTVMGMVNDLLLNPRLRLVRFRLLVTRMAWTVMRMVKLVNDHSSSMISTERMTRVAWTVMGMVNDLLLNPRLVRLRLLVTRVAWTVMGMVNDHSSLVCTERINLQQAHWSTLAEISWLLLAVCFMPMGSALRRNGRIFNWYILT